MVRSLARLRLFCVWFALGCGASLVLAAAAPLLVGDRSFTVLSGSMAPAIEPGDVVVTEPIAPEAARVGDIVAFSDPEGTGRLISHRVERLRRVGEEVRFVTRGDANTSTEHWGVPASGTIGRFVYRIPKVGYALVFTGTWWGRISLVAVPALLLCGIALSSIWRRPGRAEAV